MFDPSCIRKHIKTKRLSLSGEYRTKAAKQFLSFLQTVFQQLSVPQHIGIYLAGKGELDLSLSIDWLWSQGHLLYAPVLAGKALRFCEYTAKTPLKSNQYGLMEPNNSKSIPLQNLDYVFVPLVAFDSQGHRLGMGKGYYDHTFAFRKTCEHPLLIGCAYAFQEVPLFEIQAHDVNMDQIWTTPGI